MLNHTYLPFWLICSSSYESAASVKYDLPAFIVTLPISGPGLNVNLLQLIVTVRMQKHKNICFEPIIVVSRNLLSLNNKNKKPNKHDPEGDVKFILKLLFFVYFYKYI